MLTLYWTSSICEATASSATLRTVVYRLRKTTASCSHQQSALVERKTNSHYVLWTMTRLAAYALELKRSPENSFGVAQE